MQDSPQPARAGSLHIVATPIGNLRDITLHALDVLRSADLIAAEDTRHTQPLLAAYGIQARLMAVHEHNEAGAAERIVAVLREGRSVAYVSDAGTPGVSDPGARLARAVRAAGLKVVPIPGASAVATALSVSGIEGPWLFAGFLPAQAGARRTELERLRTLACSLVFYEAPHRIRETVSDLAEGLEGERELVIARELTKHFEQVHVCRLDAALVWLDGDENHRRGEFVLLVGPAPAQPDDDTEARRVLAILLAELPLRQATQLAAKLTGGRRNALYDLALTLRPEQ